MPYADHVHPVLLHIGAILIPSYGAFAALGVLAGLFVAQHTARVAGLNTSQIWNLCVIALFTALAAQRLLLIAANLNALRLHPVWLLTLAMVHHPLLSAAGAAAGVAAAALCARWQRMPLLTTADALAAPVALGLACEQVGALMAGSGYGTETSVAWAVTYTHPLAAIWSGTPLGIPLHPVQAYAAIGFLALAIFLLLWRRTAKQRGDLAGLWLLGTGFVVYLTELRRDPEGRGIVLNGVLDAPQIAAVGMVLIGAVALRERKAQPVTSEAVHG